ncbi:MAG: hypothetical protein EPO28_00110 [Saprospiraceae bacterium]|nr:MAG: hypothetical protein EPO28_00110 [Saprospiraceae bacterium]
MDIIREPEGVDFTTVPTRLTDEDAAEISAFIENLKAARRAQREMLEQEVKHLSERHPDLPLKQAVIALLAPLPDFLPAQNIVEAVAFIAEKWEQRKATKEAVA